MKKAYMTSPEGQPGVISIELIAFFVSTGDESLLSLKARIVYEQITNCDETCPSLGRGLERSIVLSWYPYSHRLHLIKSSGTLKCHARSS